MARTPSTMLPLGTPLPHFELVNVQNGNRFSSDSLGASPVLVMFICNHCPFVIHLHQGLTNFISDYQDRIKFVAISSNDIENYPQDSPEKMKELLTSLNWDIPYLYDETQAVAKNFNAACTPDFYLFNAESKLVYRGQFDGSRPGNKVLVTGNDLRTAVEQVLDGRSVSNEQIPSLGCNIKWIHGNEPEYFK